MSALQHITLSAGDLHLTFADGHVQVLAAADLRRACRCAGCESARRRGQAPAAAALGVSILQLVALGSTGLQLIFSDGHQRGIYPYAYLRELAS